MQSLLLKGHSKIDVRLFVISFRHLLGAYQLGIKSYFMRYLKTFIYLLLSLLLTYYFISFPLTHSLTHSVQLELARTMLSSLTLNLVFTWSSVFEPYILRTFFSLYKFEFSVWKFLHETVSIYIPLLLDKNCT